MTKFSSREDPGYKAVLGEIRRWTKASGKGGEDLNTSGQAVYWFRITRLRYAVTDDFVVCEFWMLPRRSSPLFTGRQEILHRLSHQLARGLSISRRGPSIFVIVGRGGTGKSEVCLKFAEDHRNM